MEAEYVAATNLIRHAIRDVAGLEALIEALDADLQKRGYVDRKGVPRDSSVLRMRATSRLAKARLELLELVRQERIAEQARQAVALREKRGSVAEAKAMNFHAIMEAERAEDKRLQARAKERARRREQASLEDETKNSDTEK